MAQNDGGGSEKKQKDKKGNGQENGQKKQQKDGPVVAELLMDVHCATCAKKIMTAVSGIEGVSKVNIDVEASKVIVEGKMDSEALRQRIEKKCNKKVALVPPSEGKGNNGGSGGNKKGKNNKTKDAEEQQDGVDQEEESGEGKGKKDKAKSKQPTPVEVKVVLRCNCTGCNEKLRKIVHKLKGLDTVMVEFAKGSVTLRGIGLDPKDVERRIKEKFKRAFDVVLVGAKEEGKKKGGNKDNKNGNQGDEEAGEKKNNKKNNDGNGDDAGGDTAGNNGGSGGKGKKGGGGGGNANRAPGGVYGEVMQSAQYMMPHLPGYYAPGYPPHQGYPGAPMYYHMDVVQGPPMFSDENPNACSVM